MGKLRQIIVELRHTSKLEGFFTGIDIARRPQMKESLLPSIRDVKWDLTFPAVEIPAAKEVELEKDNDPRDIAELLTIDDDRSRSTYVVRAKVPNGRKLEALEKAVKASEVVAFYADVGIEPCPICPGDPAKGNDGNVEKLLCVDRLHRCGMDGSGVTVAIVDTGINLDYLRAKGKHPNHNVELSWVPREGLEPFQLPVNHGTMCAFDACIAAPKCTLLDIALLQSTAGGKTIMEGFLSDAILAYRHLLDIMRGDLLPGQNNSLVVNNSWGMFHPSWDYPVGHPGNYSDNPNHPFNVIVSTLERAGADILFAAGNCGRDCPDGRCQGETTSAIYGANSHPKVLCVAGVDVDKDRVGYSAIGPGRLYMKKPDISGYTHFKGSEVYAADGGTSAACPVVTGVVAAVRTKFPFKRNEPGRSPEVMRAAITKTAEDRGQTGYDYAYGWGIVNGCKLAEVLCKETPEPEEPPRREACCIKVETRVRRCDGKDEDAEWKEFEYRYDP